MPNKKEREHILDITWFYAKIVFALTIFGLSLFAVGTYYPNQKTVVKISNKIDAVYVNKIKEMDLQEPDFIYANDIQFVKVMHKCINYINFTTPKNLRVPYEMIIGQAALKSSRAFDSLVWRFSDSDRIVIDEKIGWPFRADPALSEY